MNFQEAHLALRAGKYVTREAWKDGSYLAFLPGMVSIFKITVQPAPNVGNFLWLDEDFGATDYVAYDRRDDVPPPAQA